MDGKRTSVAIVGGSLVGPTAELLLRRAGFEDVTTYEALPLARSQSGGVMGLRSDTTATLANLGVDLDSITALDDPNVWAYDVLPGHRVEPRGASEFPGRLTSWDKLHQSLRERVDVRRRHRLVKLEDRGAAWHLTFANGEEREAGLVIFADGRKSTGRELLDPGRPLRYAGYVTWRGLVDPPEPAPRGFERYYDASHGRLFSITAPLNGVGRSYWELSHNLPADAYASVAGGRPTERAFVLPGKLTDAGQEIVDRAARHLPQQLRDVVSHSDVAGIPVNDTTMPERAVFGTEAPAVLVGDALLPVRLQVGAGLNQGLTQVRELAGVLALAGADIEALRRLWQEPLLERLGPWVELGRSRAHRTNLGVYEPVVPGRTAIPADDQWSDPRWVSA